LHSFSSLAPSSTSFSHSSEVAAFLAGGPIHVVEVAAFLLEHQFMLFCFHLQLSQPYGL
jgi:hypothetical protein